MEQDRRQYDHLLDKVIKVTEDNLKAQNEYLQELTLIRNRFDLNDRDHNDLKQTVTGISNNTFSILNRMEKASNEHIIKILEQNEICMRENKTDLREIKKSVLDTYNSFSLIQKLLGAILIAVVGVQLVTTVVKFSKDSNNMEHLRILIQQEVQKTNKGIKN